MESNSEPMLASTEYLIRITRSNHLSIIHYCWLN